ncbi:TonB-dependent receptor [Chondrinema litorale]|uniref:TonB-dependent receptor n=1 Tax=Chondrinema litorale TaxID=2994555 RepID=UPI002542FAF2|nr:TonB-dependent receptor [Chondrinema litorale]UZR97478.1 TonB-dependent receptor [Chondrinema litorale]
MKPIFLLVLIYLSPFLSLAQEASISGIISDEHGPLPYATVSIASLGKGDVADPYGKYQISDVPTGTYKVQVSMIGYRMIEQTIEVNNKTNIQENFELLEDLMNLEQVVVSGTRYELDRSESPVVVGVLSPKLFSATQSVAISEGLNFQSGVRVETNCQNCGFTQVRLNGLEGGYSQILINSRPVFSALNSVYGLDQIPTNIVERIEVVRSGGSALYGSNAIAGTINIITKEPVENAWQVASNFSLIDGKEPDQTVQLNGTIVAEDQRSGVTFYSMHRNRDSYDANGDGFSELTKLENNTLGTKAFYKPGKNNKITFEFSSIKEFRRGGDNLDLAPHLTDITEQLDHSTIITGLSFDQLSKDKKSKYAVYTSAQTTKRESFYGGLGGGRTAADSIIASNAYGNTSDLALVTGFQFSRNMHGEDMLVVGIENQYSKVDDEIPGYNRLIAQSVNTSGIYAQYEWRPIDRFTALLGGRYDFTQVEGSYQVGNVQRSSEVETGVFSPRFTILYDLKENIQFRGGYARGFRAPQAFNEDLHISSVGGEPQFVILGNDLDKELSDAYTASLNFTKTTASTQASFLIEGFYTNLKNPFTIVSTGSTLPNGSILEEVRNGNGAYVSGANIELNWSPTAKMFFQVGGTLQQSRYKESQVIFEPESDNLSESRIETDKFLRNPNVYGYFTSSWKLIRKLDIDFTGTYTGSMTVPRVISKSGFMQLNESDQFWDMNLKLAYKINLAEHLHLEINGGMQNILNSYQKDFDTGAQRDSDYVYGPARPRTFFFGVKIGDLH